MGVLEGVGTSDPRPARREREAVRLQGPRASAGLKRDMKGNELRSLGGESERLHSSRALRKREENPQGSPSSCQGLGGR